MYKKKTSKRPLQKEVVVSLDRSLIGSKWHFSALKAQHARLTEPTTEARHLDQEQDHDTGGNHQQHFPTPTQPTPKNMVINKKEESPFLQVMVSTSYLFAHIITWRSKKLDKNWDRPMINNDLCILRSPGSNVCECPSSFKLSMLIALL